MYSSLLQRKDETDSTVVINPIVSQQSSRLQNKLDTALTQARFELKHVMNDIRLTQHYS